MRRIRKAIDVLHRSDALKDDDTPKAKLFYNGEDKQNNAFKKYLTDHNIGIDPERVIFRSIDPVNTFGQTQSLSEYLEEEAQKGNDIKHIGVVSDDFHAPRIVHMAGNTSPYAHPDHGASNEQAIEGHASIPKLLHKPLDTSAEGQAKAGMLNALGQASLYVFGTGLIVPPETHEGEQRGIASAQSGIYYNINHRRQLTGEAVAVAGSILQVISDFAGKNGAYAMPLFVKPRLSAAVPEIT